MLGKWFSTMYDFFMTPFEKKRFKVIRKRLIAQAEGDVLEIGSGTGINFPYYVNACHVTAIEPNTAMLEKSLRQISNHRVPICVCSHNAETLPYTANTFDTVVGTLVFCTIPDPDKALAEIRRVLKPNGRMLLFEHVRLNHTILGKTQDVLTPIWKHLCDGCCLNRNTLQMVARSGLHIEKVESIYKGLFQIIQVTNPKS